MSEALLELPATPRNPVEPFLRMGRMPHIWCPACGIGTTVNCFTRALESSKLDLDKVAILISAGFVLMLLGKCGASPAPAVAAPA